MHANSNGQIQIQFQMYLRIQIQTAKGKQCITTDCLQMLQKILKSLLLFHHLRKFQKPILKFLPYFLQQVQMIHHREFLLLYVYLWDLLLLQLVPLLRILLLLFLKITNYTNLNFLLLLLHLLLHLHLLIIITVQYQSQYQYQNQNQNQNLMMFSIKLSFNQDFLVGLKIRYFEFYC